MTIHPVVQVLLALMALTCGFALWKGGPPERLGTAILIANVIAGLILDPLLPGYRGVGGLAVDAITAFAFLALTLRYALPWLGVALLIFALQFGLHAFYFVTARSPHERLHSILNNLNFVAVLICLTVATIGAIRRRQALRSA